MNNLDLTAYKMKCTPATPSVPGSKATYEQERSFRCNWREISAQENVKAGRNSSGKGKRFFYFPARVRFAYGDRILFDGLYYEIMYIPEQGHSVAINYVDTKALQ
jgi:hypothetical protein